MTMTEMAACAAHLLFSQSRCSNPNRLRPQLIIPKSRSKSMVKTRAAAPTEVAYGVRLATRKNVEPRSR